MKKVIFIICILFVNTDIYSQNRYYYLGLSEINAASEILKENDNSSIEINEEPKEGNTFFNWTSKKWNINYILHFDEKGIAWFYGFNTPDIKIANTIIKKYNKDFIIISNRQWKYYVDDKIISIIYNYSYTAKRYVFAFHLL